MKTRIRDVFDHANAEQRAALVVYLCAGDPDLPTTLKLIHAVSEAGADVIELGVPFSDPTADGVIIQRASERSLASGTTLRKVLDVVRQARKSVTTPILLFGYYNPLFVYGVDRVIEDANTAGVDGFLVVDLPPDAGDSFPALVVQHQLAYIPLVAPTSTKERIEAASRLGNGFLYYVSVTGVTGTHAVDLKEASRHASEIAKSTQMPVAVGFGIKTPEDVATVAKQAQGVVVGSAIVSLMEQARDPEAGIHAVKTFVRQLKSKVWRPGVVPV